MTELDAGTQPLGRIARVPLLAPLGIRDFRFVWLGESVSLLGDQFNTVALAWLVLGLTGSGFALGVILIASAIPRGLFMLIGGVLSDRISPRDLALASNVLRAILTTIVAGLVIGERVELWQLAAVGVVFGTVDAVFLPAINTLVPRLVPAERLAAANAVMQGTGQLVGTVGPAIAGFAVAVVGVGAAFAVDAASFAVAALMLWFVRLGRDARRPDRRAVAPAATPALRPPATSAERPSIRASLVEGGRVVLGDPVMRSIVILSTAANLAFTGSIVIGLPWLVLVRFGGDASSLGLLFAAYGAGSLAGVVAGGSLPHPRRFGSIVPGLRAHRGRRPRGHRARAVADRRRRHPARHRRPQRLGQRRRHRLGPGPDGSGDARADDELPDARVGRRGALVARPRGGHRGRPRDGAVPRCRTPRHRVRRRSAWPAACPVGWSDERATMAP